MRTPQHLPHSRLYLPPPVPILDWQETEEPSDDEIDDILYVAKHEEPRQYA